MATVGFVAVLVDAVPDDFDQLGTARIRSAVDDVRVLGRARIGSIGGRVGRGDARILLRYDPAVFDASAASLDPKQIDLELDHRSDGEANGSVTPRYDVAPRKPLHAHLDGPARELVTKQEDDRVLSTGQRRRRARSECGREDFRTVLEGALDRELIELGRRIVVDVENDARWIRVAGARDHREQDRASRLHVMRSGKQDACWSAIVRTQTSRAAARTLTGSG